MFDHEMDSNGMQAERERESVRTMLKVAFDDKVMGQTQWCK